MKRWILAPGVLVIAALAAWLYLTGDQGEVAGLHAEVPAEHDSERSPSRITAPGERAPGPDASVEAREAESPDREALAGEAPSLPTSGRCFDLNSGDPLFELRVKALREDDWTASWTTDDGTFEMRRYLEPPLRFEVIDLGSKINVPAEQVRTLEDGSYEIGLDAGPTYFLDITFEGERPELDRLEVALHEELPGLDEPRIWKSGSIRDPYGKPWVRFSRREHEVSPAATGTLVVRTRAGTLEARAEVLTTVGTQREIVRLHLDLAGAVAVGRVVHENGMPGDHTRVVAIPLDEHGREFSIERWTRSRTDDEGAYFIANLEPGPYRIVAERQGSCGGHVEAKLGLGRTQVEDIVIDTRPVRGAISGTLAAPPGGIAPTAFLTLRCTDGCEISRIGSAGILSEVFDAEQRPAPFEFEDVPEGTYELTVLSMDGRDYTPRSIEVSPPISGIVFTSETVLEDVKRGDNVTLEVYDAESGERLESFDVLFGNAQRWLPEPMSLEFGNILEEHWAHRIVIHAEGYRPKLLADVRPVAGSPRTEKVYLERGFGLTLLVRANEPTTTLNDFESYGLQVVSMVLPPLGAVRARSGSKVLGTSNDLGLLILSADERPETLELHHERFVTQRGLEPNLETPFQLVLMQPR